MLLIQNRIAGMNGGFYLSVAALFLDMGYAFIINAAHYY